MTDNLPHIVRFWGWTENKREEERDLKELSERAAKGLSLYGDSDQPEWVKESAARNSMWSQAYLREWSSYVNVFEAG